MTALQKISFKQIKNSRGRFWTTVVGVTLSTAMILAVLLGSDAGIDALRRYVVGQNGNWHWSVDQLPAEAILPLMNDSLSKQSGVYGGKVIATSSENAQLSIYGVSGDFLNMMQTEIMSGNMPQSPNEILVGKQFAEKYNLSIGDTLYTTVENSKELHMTVVGIYSSSVLNWQLLTSEDTFNVFYGIDLNRPIGENVYRFFSVSEKLDATYYTHADNLSQSLSATYPNIISFYQGTLITLSGALGPDGTNRTLFYINLLRGVLLLVIAGASGMMIVNSFYISLSERKQTLGMLVSIGATGQQTALCLLYEAICVGIIGIPLGLIFGCSGLDFAFTLLSPMLKNMKHLIGADLSLHIIILPQWLIISTIISAVVLLISAWLPARSFAKESTFQAILNNGEVKISKHVTKTGKLAEKIFGPEVAVAVKSAKRNRRRYFATVSSMAISIALFIAAAGLAQYFLQVYDANAQTAEYPISVDYAVTSEQYLTQTDIYKVLMHPETPVSAILINEKIMLDTINIPASVYTAKAVQLATLLNAYKEDDLYSADIEWNVVSDKEFDQVVGSKTLPKGTIACILANHYFYSNESVMQTNYKRGDTLQAQIKGMPITLYIATVDQQKYVGNRPGDITRLNFIVGQTTANTLIEQWQQIYKSAFPRIININYGTNYPDELQAELDVLSYNNGQSNGMVDYLVVSNNSLLLLATQIMHRLLKIILYGFSALIGLICICHVATTVSTGLVLQRREFATLQSLGITEKGLFKMILAQSAVHSLEALVFGVPLGFALLWIEYIALSRIVGFVFTVPLWSILVAVVVSFGIAVLAAIPHMRTIRRNSIMQNMR